MKQAETPSLTPSHEKEPTMKRRIEEVLNSRHMILITHRDVALTESHWTIISGPTKGYVNRKLKKLLMEDATLAYKVQDIRTIN